MSIVACTTQSNPEANRTANNISANSTAGTVAQTDKANIDQEITTTPLSPTPIRIPLEELPEPFASDSASNPPQVVDIPANPVLNVPEGFTVNV